MRLHAATGSDLAAAERSSQLEPSELSDPGSRGQFIIIYTYLWQHNTKRNSIYIYIRYHGLKSWAHAMHGLSNDYTHKQLDAVLI